MLIPDHILTQTKLPEWKQQGFIVHIRKTELPRRLFVRVIFKLRANADVTGYTFGPACFE
jgi:hypothetical protein